MWHQWFNHNFTKLWEYFLCANQYKNNDFILQFVSSTSTYSAILESITCVNNICCSVSAAPYTDTFCVLMRYYPKWHFRVTQRRRMVNVLFFLAHKIYSRNFVKLHLNHWCHMDYFNDTMLAMFLSLNRVRILAVYGRVRELSGMHTNILICFLKMKEGLTGLGRYEGE